jgi:hypothetical protein
MAHGTIRYVECVIVGEGCCTRVEWSFCDVGPVVQGQGDAGAHAVAHDVWRCQSNVATHAHAQHRVPRAYPGPLGVRLDELLGRKCISSQTETVDRAYGRAHSKIVGVLFCFVLFVLFVLFCFVLLQTISISAQVMGRFDEGPTLPLEYATVTVQDVVALLTRSVLDTERRVNELYNIITAAGTVYWQGCCRMIVADVVEGCACLVTNQACVWRRTTV